MQIELSGEIERLVAEKLASGRYGSADDVFQQALQLLDERDTDIKASGAGTREKIVEGWWALRQGEGVDGRVFFVELERVEKALASRAGSDGA